MKRASRVRRYHPVDLRFSGAAMIANPFYAGAKGFFSGPNGEAIVVPSFYDGDCWVVRFAPVSAGLWHYRLESSAIDISEDRGTIFCVENDNPNVHGGLRVRRDTPHHFGFEDGAPYFFFGYEADWLWAMALEEGGIARVREFVGLIKRFRFNQILMNVYAHDTPWRPGKTGAFDYGPPSIYAWEGTNERPDHSRPNVSFFRRYDEVIRCLFEEGVVAHLFLKVFNKFVKWPPERSDDDDLFLKYVIARYQAFPNVIWDIAKESYYVPDKDYLLERIGLIRAHDGYGRLVTIHDDPLFYHRAGDKVDFYTAQQVYDFYLFVLREREKRAWPVVNAEFAYEWPNRDGEIETPAGKHTAEEVAHRAYETVMAGGYPVYYYNNTAWDVIDYEHIPKGYEYMRILYDFFTSLQWWDFAPHPELLCWHGKFRRMLARPGKEYVVYCEAKANVLMNLGLDAQALSGFWMNTHSGDKVPASPVTPDREHISSKLALYRCPFETAPGLLHLAVV